MKRTTLKVSVRNVLDLVIFGNKNNINIDKFYEKLANLLQNVLSEEEIKEYSGYYLSKEAELKGYSKEDYEKCLDVLEGFRENYF